MVDGPAGVAHSAAAADTTSASDSPGRRRALVSATWQNSIPRPSSAPPCRLDHTASGGTASQIRRDWRRASARSSRTSAGIRISENSCTRAIARLVIDPRAASARAAAVGRPCAPPARASRAASASPTATATSCASIRPRSPSADSSAANSSSAATSGLGQCGLAAAANGTPAGTLPRAATWRPSAASQRASDPIRTDTAISATITAIARQGASADPGRARERAGQSRICARDRHPAVAVHLDLGLAALVEGPVPGPRRPPTKLAMSTRGMTRSLRVRAGEERGVVLILVAILLTAILASAALAIDLGSFYQAQTRAQSAADAAALAAAQDLAGSSSTAAAADGTTIAQTNYPGATVTVSQPTTNEAKVTVNASSPSIFGQALGLTSARAAATGTTTRCTSPGSNCYAIFAMDTSCSNPPIMMTGGGNDVNGAMWSNGSINVGGGGSEFGPTYYGNGSGCAMLPSLYQQQNNTFTAGPTQSAPQTTWPVDYSKDFPPCGSSGEPACTGPCDVSTTPCPAANLTPSFCTQATNASSETLYSWYPHTLQSGNIYCDVGSGVAGNPSTWNGEIIADQSGSTPIAATYVAGSFSVGGGSILEPCGYSISGYQPSGCSSSVPTPVTGSYPLVYVTGSGSPFNFPGGGGSLTGDVFAPNGALTWDAGGTTIVGFLEAQDVVWQGGGMTGDGPVASSVGSSSGPTVSLLQ